MSLPNLALSNQQEEPADAQDNGNPYLDIKTYSMGCYSCWGSKLKSYIVIKTGLLLDQFGYIVEILKMGVIRLFFFDENQEHFIYALWPFFFMLLCIFSLRNLIKFSKLDRNTAIETIKKIISSCRCYNFSRIIYIIVLLLKDANEIVYMVSMAKEGVEERVDKRNVKLEIFITIALQAITGIYWITLLFFSCVQEAALNSLKDFNNKLKKEIKNYPNKENADSNENDIRISNIGMLRESNDSDIRDQTIIDITVENSNNNLTPSVKNRINTTPRSRNRGVSEDIVLVSNKIGNLPSIRKHETEPKSKVAMENSYQMDESKININDSQLIEKNKL